jgi:Natural resistance-associated macrophage protein
VTYSQAGAQYGLDMLWKMPLALPLMAAIQAICAQIRHVIGKGWAANIKTAFPPVILQSVVLLLLIAKPPAEAGISRRGERPGQGSPQIVDFATVRRQVVVPTKNYIRQY